MIEPTTSPTLEPESTRQAQSPCFPATSEPTTSMPRDSRVSRLPGKHHATQGAARAPESPLDGQGAQSLRIAPPSPRSTDLGPSPAAPWPSPADSRARHLAERFRV